MSASPPPDAAERSAAGAATHDGPGAFEPPAPGPGRRGRWIVALSLAAVVAATAWVLHRSGAGFVDAARAFPPAAHLAALLLAAVEVASRGARVSVVARGLGIPLGVAASTRAQLAGDALAAVTPARAGSDPAKLAALRSAGVPLGSGGALLLAEILLESAVLLASSVVIVLLFPGLRWVAWGLSGYAATVVGLGAAAVWLSGTVSRGTPSGRRRFGISPATRARVLGSVEEFRARARELRGIAVGWVALGLLATALHMATRLAVLPTLALSVPWEGGAPALRELVLRPFFILYATALLPPPGGGGGVEIAFAQVLDGTVGAARVGAALVWWRVYTFYLTAAVGGLVWAGRHALRPR